MKSYVLEVLTKLKNRYPWEKEFIQSVSEILESLTLMEGQAAFYRKNAILERLTEPDRIITFKVPWRDDRGQIQVNTGHRVEFSNLLGPYKGGLRFHSSVSLSTLKFLGFEQIFKNALTGLALGGGKGGSDFNPSGKSDQEVMNFCQSFMMELYRHIGANIDVPAGDIGVGAREIGYLFGTYRRLTNSFEGAITGKGVQWGGSFLRPQATGYGVTYFAQEMLKRENQSIEGKRVALSGFGNVCWGAALKVTELGGKVITLSGPDGFIYDPKGVSGEKIDYMLTMRSSGRDQIEDYAKEFKVEFHPKKRPWGVPCDIAMPCAIQNEMNREDVAELIKNGVGAIVEGANLPLTLDAMELVTASKVLYAPGKASNAGGVACSGFEMAQNALFMNWSEEEVDKKLQAVMKSIHDCCYETALEYGRPKDYVVGANISGFKRVASAMIAQGIN